MSRRRKQIPQDPKEYQVTSLSHDGRGIARLNDKVTFIFGALPGEKVIAKVIKSFNRYDEATTIKVIEASPDRVDSPCQHFGLCGGCQLQHLKPSSQIQYKQAFLSDLLKHQAKVTPKEWMAPLTGESLGYRQKARLGVRYVNKKEALLVGFREQGNNKIAMIDSCQVLDPRVGLKIDALREVINAMNGRETIAQIEVAGTKNEVALVFRHLKPLNENDTNLLLSFCKENHFSFYLQPGGVDSLQKIWPDNKQEYLNYELKDQNLNFQFHPLDFTQVNHEINQKMVNSALALLNINANETVLDLFCGLGNFSLPMAQRAKRVVGIEGTELMVKRAQKNANLNNLFQVEFFACDLSKDFTLQRWANEQYDKILLDPPRLGAEEVVNKINRFKAKEILYISCNPTTFARDAAILVNQHNYTLEKVGVMDMFPHTAHVETIGLFTHG